MLCWLGSVPVVGAQRGQRVQSGAVLAGVARERSCRGPRREGRSPICQGLVR